MAFKITDKSFEIEEKINRALARVIDEAASQMNPDIGEKLKPLVISKWKKSATYYSLVYGDLNGKIGFPRNTAKTSVESILEEAARSIKISYEGTQVFKRKFRTKIGVYILKQDLFNVLDSISGVIETEEQTLLHWTDWLLTKGDKIIISGWRYLGYKGLGRSSMGIMSKGGSFRIPPIHSGVIGDNWLTRVIESFVVEISLASKVIIEQELKRNL